MARRRPGPVPFAMAEPASSSSIVFLLRCFTRERIMVCRVFIVAVFVSLMLIPNAHSRQPVAVNPIDIDNPAESGEGAGCVFLARSDETQRPIFVDRDDVGWIKVGKQVEKLRPAKKGVVMWPSMVGKRLALQYQSGETYVGLDIEVASGCTSQYDDNCSVRYSGNLAITAKEKVRSIPVTGYCVH